MADFTSTRNRALRADAREAVLNGIAPDGGLYIPAAFPVIDVKDILSLSYSELAKRVIFGILSDFTEEEISSACDEAYLSHFDTMDVCPLVKVGSCYALELFHGETCAFKDIALSILPRLMVRARKARGLSDRTLILTATSGDTGSAAMNGFKNVSGTGIITFYPYGGVSEIQKKQMTCMDGENLTACAVKGNFDDCQTAVKKAFADLLPPVGIRFSSANSINIARLVPQITYYFWTYVQLVNRFHLSIGEKVDFIVPTGNFGDILAGEYARWMGLPVGKLVCASNANRVLTDFLETGRYDRKRAFRKTLSPSMDILISSNLERMLYHAENGDAERVCAHMKALSTNGEYQVSPEAHDRFKEDFAAYSFDDAATLQTMKQVFDETGYLPDPHTAVGFACEKEYGKCQSDRPRVILSTASPFKFPQSALKALGIDDPEDPFEQLEVLSRAISVPVPASIQKLQNARPLHTDIITQEEIFDYILGKAEKLCKA